MFGRIIRCVLIASVVSVPITALAAQAFVSGNDLYERCTEPPPGSGPQVACNGYILGVADLLMMDERVCMPHGVVSQQLLDIVVKYLRDNPAKRQFSGASETTLALTDAFPCNK